MKKPATKEARFAESFPGILIRIFGQAIGAPPGVVEEKLDRVERKYRRRELP